MKPINVGLLGIGTVGGGTFEVLARNQEEITRRAGRGIAIKMVADKDLDRARKLVREGAIITADANEVVGNPDIDIVIELIGGTTIAHELVLKAIRNGKHVVTANKALLAKHGNEIFAVARERGVMVAFVGEIYNYEELRRELADYPFRTKSDTEVLLVGYVRHGIRWFERLRGMFAVAIAAGVIAITLMAMERAKVERHSAYITRAFSATSTEVKIAHRRHRFDAPTAKPRRRTERRSPEPTPGDRGKVCRVW